MSQVQFDFQPLPVFRDFHASTLYERALFGGYGSGKSFSLCAEAIAVGLEQPGAEILICRHTIPSLRDTTEAIFESLLPTKFFQSCKTSRMGGHYESIVFPNGSKYMFRGLDDWKKLKSLNLAWIFYDEADEIDEETYTGMMSRVRQRVPLKIARDQGAPPIQRRGIVTASNPAGHNWLWKRFVGPSRVANSAWFKSTSLDNPFLPLTYIDSLLAMPEPWVRRYVLCEFDEFAGQIYEDWGWDTHVIKPYRDAAGRYHYDPGGWFVMGFDPGTYAGNAALWCYNDRERNLIVGVAEYLEHGLAAKQHATAWRKIEALHGMRGVRTRIADPVIGTRDRGSNMTLEDQYRRLGYSFQHGPRPIDQRLPALGGLIFSGRFKVTEDCPQTYEQILNYRYEDLTPVQREKGTEAKPLKKNVDLVDAAQYVASRHVAPPKIEDTEALSDSELFARLVNGRIRKQIKGRNATGSHDLGSIPL